MASIDCSTSTKESGCFALKRLKVCISLCNKRLIYKLNGIQCKKSISKNDGVKTSEFFQMIWNYTKYFMANCKCISAEEHSITNRSHCKKSMAGKSKEINSAKDRSIKESDCTKSKMINLVNWNQSMSNREPYKRQRMMCRKKANSNISCTESYKRSILKNKVCKIVEDSIASKINRAYNISIRDDTKCNCFVQKADIQCSSSNKDGLHLSELSLCPHQQVQTCRGEHLN